MPECFERIGTSQPNSTCLARRSVLVRPIALQSIDDLLFLYHGTARTTAPVHQCTYPNLKRDQQPPHWLVPTHDTVLLVEASNGAFHAHEAEVNRALEPNSKPVPCHLHEERNSVAEPLSETVNSKASKSAIIKQSKRMYKCTKTEHVTQHVPAEFLLVSALLHSFIYRRLMTTRRRSPHVPCQHRTVKIQTQRPSASGAVGWLKFCSFKLSLVSEPNYYSRICTSQLQFFFS